MVTRVSRLALGFAGIKLFPITPYNLVLVFTHQLSCRVFAPHVCPCTCKVYDEHAWLPFLLVFIKACNLLWKSVQLPLWYARCPFGIGFVLLDQLRSGVLLTQLIVLLLCGSMKSVYGMDEVEGARVGAKYEGA